MWNIKDERIQISSVWSCNGKHPGFSRGNLFISLGSCAELETQIEIACDLEYMMIDERNKLLEILDHESRMLRNLIKKL
jgi:four helix bundle protein